MNRAKSRELWVFGTLFVLMVLGACDRTPRTPTPRSSATSPKAPIVDAGTVLGPPHPDSARVLPAAPRTKLVFLGTGTPVPDPDRSGQSLAIVVDDVPFLVDAGPGVVRRAAAASSKGRVPGLQASQLGRVFITHLHSDHTLGLPDLVFSPWVLGRVEPLEIWGPPGLDKMVEHIQQAWEEDIRIRREGLEALGDRGHRANVHEIVLEREVPAIVLDSSRLKVTAFAVKHGGWKSALGYRFDTPDRSIVVSGDTRPTDTIARMCDGCDILVHEVYSKRAYDGLPPGPRRYHASFHTSTTQLADLAGRARPKLLVLTHQLTWGAPAEILVEEIEAAGYGGPVLSARDLDVF